LEAFAESGETQLRRAYVHLSEAQRLSQTGSFTWDFSGTELFWSEELYRIFELDPITAITTDLVRTFVHPDDVTHYDSTVEGAAAGLDIDLAYRIVTPSGVLKHLRAVGHRVEHAAERPVFIGAVQDVTAARIAEEALTARETELRQAYAFLTEAQRLSRTGSYTWDALSNEEIWTDELYRIFELDPGTRMTWSVVREFVHPDDRLMIETTNERGIVGEEPDYFCRIITGSGALKHVHVVAHRSELVPGRPVYVGAIQDITESKLAEEALNRARAELAHVNRVMALSALTASIAHEVNQPLASLVTNASTCLRMLAADPPNLDVAQTTAQRTIRDANRASDVIQRLRAMFARKQQASEPVDLTEAAREVLALSASEFQRAGVVLRSDLPDTLPSVRGDRVQLQQVILNLVLNATDAMRTIDGRPRNLWIATGLEAPDKVRLSVRDEGTGIEPQNLARLFDAFYTTKSEGMGIGLSISRSIIQSHDGRLWAEANEGGPGATFSFTIPCDVAGTAKPLRKDV
jgi:signal transduction histidine kinase